MRRLMGNTTTAVHWDSSMMGWENGQAEAHVRTAQHSTARAPDEMGRDEDAIR